MEFDSNIGTQRENRIISYLRGEMKGQELEDFLKELKRDPELRLQTDRIRNLRKVIDKPQLAKIESSLLDLRKKNIEAIYSQMHPLKKMWHKTSSKIKVAVLIALLVMTSALIIAFNSKDADKLYGKYFIQYPTMVALAPDQLIEKAAMDAYEKNELDDAIQRLESLREQDVYELYYISANMKRYADADSANLELINNFQNRFNEERLKENIFDQTLYHWAEYYKALIYFKEGLSEIKEARRIVNSLVEKVEAVPLKVKVEELKNEIGSAFLF